MKELKRRLKKRMLQGYLRLVRSPGAPSEVAGGMAVGLFISMLPIIQVPVAVGLTEALRRVFRVKLSSLAAAAGVFLTNPLTGPVMYGAAFVVGHPFARWLLPPERLADAGMKLSLQDLSWAGPFALEVLTSLAIGGALLGVPIAIAGFFLTRSLVRRYQLRRLQRARPVPALSAAA